MTRLPIKLFTAAIASISFLPLSGQETMVLKNGSRLYGHTSKEDFTAKTVTFMADSAIIVEAMSDIYYTAPSVQRLNNMKHNWRRWFEANPAKVFINGGKKSGLLGNISYSDGSKNEFEGDAVIIERSNDNISFFTINHANITVKKNAEVDHFEYATRDPLALVGIVNEIVPVNGTTLQGQIIEDYPSRLVLLTDDGVRNVIPYNNIKAKRVLPFNTNRSLTEQLRYLTRITYKDDSGEQRTVDGIIRETVYKPSGDERPYYEVINADGTSPRKYYFDDVVMLSLSPNSMYIQDRDVVINDDEILIEHKEARNMKHAIKSDRYEINDTAGIVKLNYSYLAEGNIKVYYKDIPANSEFIFVEAKPNYIPSKTDNKNRKDEEDELPVYFYANFSEMFLNSFTPYDRFVSPASNVSVNYGKVQAGKYYLLIRKSDNSTYLIKIEP